MPWEAPNPDLPQKRKAATASGAECWIEISGTDRLAAINALPRGWAEMIRDRENGLPYETLANRARCSREDFDLGMGQCYSILETALHDLARARGRMIP